MEVHISSDDRNFITNVCNAVADRLTKLKGYACVSGYNLKNQYEYKVFKGTDDLTEKFPNGFERDFRGPLLFLGFTQYENNLILLSITLFFLNFTLVSAFRIVD